VNFFTSKLLEKTNNALVYKILVSRLTYAVVKVPLNIMLISKIS